MTPHSSPPSVSPTTARWSMAAFCYGLQGAAQAALALGASGAEGPVGRFALCMWGLSIMSLLCALIHKNRGFEAAQDKLRMPWPARYNQMAFCIALMMLSVQAKMDELLSPVWSGWVAIAFAAAAGWAASRSRLES